MSKKDYPMLNNFLESKKVPKRNDDKYSLDNLIKFNKVLNERYSNKISKEIGKQIIKDSDIYQDSTNSRIIDNFIKLYNKFELEEKGKKITLSIDKNSLSNFFVYDDKNNI